MNKKKFRIASRHQKLTDLFSLSNRLYRMAQSEVKTFVVEPDHMTAARVLNKLSKISLSIDNDIESRLSHVNIDDIKLYNHVRDSSRFVSLEIDRACDSITDLISKESNISLRKEAISSLSKIAMAGDFFAYKVNKKFNRKG